MPTARRGGQRTARPTTLFPPIVTYGVEDAAPYILRKICAKPLLNYTVSCISAFFLVNCYKSILKGAFIP